MTDAAALLGYQVLGLASFSADASHFMLYITAVSSSVPECFNVMLDVFLCSCFGTRLVISLQPLDPSGL